MRRAPGKRARTVFPAAPSGAQILPQKIVLRSRILSSFPFSSPNQAPVLHAGLNPEPALLGSVVRTDGVRMSFT